MKVYYYYFYKLYKFWETAPSRFWSEWKASLSIIVIQIWLIVSLFVYYKVFINRFYQLNENLLLGIGFFVFIMNYFVFHQKDKWKSKIQEFDSFSKRKNIIGGIIVWSLTVVVIIIIIFSFYLMSKIEWTAYQN